jgi:hypothetical protein
LREQEDVFVVLRPEIPPFFISMRLMFFELKVFIEKFLRMAINLSMAFEMGDLDGEEVGMEL